MACDTYEKALDYLFSSTDYEKMRHVRYNADTFSLDRMRRLTAALGSPERSLRTVHVAGTKGKGSTAAMVHATALACGLRAGLYTSPHLVDIRERIRVGREDIAPEDLRRQIAAAQPVIDRLRAGGDAATFFEIFTALALRHFADAGVDLAVVEVGMGGRLDATNVLAPDVSVITAISLDHMSQLGSTLAAIAGEKAGIVKPGVPVVSQPQPPEAMAVIERACREAGAPLVVVGREVTYTWRPAEEGGRRGGRLTVRTPAAEYADLFVPLMGEHQAVNACAAIAAAERAGPLAGRLTRDVVRDGLAGVSWPGRMEFVPGTPDLLLDGAHNRASVERLAEGLGRHFAGRRLGVVFAAAADKDLQGMMAGLVEQLPAAAVVFTKAASPRSAEPADLAALYAKAGGRGAETAATPTEAVALAARRAGPQALVVVTGSLYLVGQIEAMIRTGDGNVQC